MDGNITVGQMMQIGAWGLMLGTLFFSTFGIRAEKDYFLVMGLVCCTLGDLIFAFYLWDQPVEEGGSGNDTMVTAYLVLAGLSVYALYCQLHRYRMEGFDDSDDEEEEEAAAAAPAAAPARQPAAAVAAHGGGGPRPRPTTGLTR